MGRAGRETAANFSHGRAAAASDNGAPLSDHSRTLRCVLEGEEQDRISFGADGETVLDGVSRSFHRGFVQPAFASSCSAAPI
jgi:hypothetical protein